MGLKIKPQTLIYEWIASHWDLILLVAGESLVVFFVCFHFNLYDMIAQQQKMVGPPYQVMEWQVKGIGNLEVS